MRKPDWIRVQANFSKEYTQIKRITRDMNLHTVCEEAGCPNIYECYSAKTATFLILGDKCTRNCSFCLIDKNAPGLLDIEEPKKVAKAVKMLGLDFAVVTSVTRDDLEDGGASVFVQTIEEIKRMSPECKVEILIPDFKGDRKALELVAAAKPDVLNHNMETVERLYPAVRPRFSYKQSLELLKTSKELLNGGLTKSGLIAGMGETIDELKEAITDLKRNSCDILTIGQYLSPSRNHLPIHKYYSPVEFDGLRVFAEKIGFKKVVSGPLVRSSYHAAAATE